MKKPLHVLYLARWYPHKFDNMYGLFIKRHAQSAALKHQISVFYVHACDHLDHPHETEIIKGSINEYFYYYRKPKTGIRFLDALISNFRLVKGHWVLWKKITRPDLIHVHILTRLGVIAYFINKWKNIPYVITEHWSRYQKGNRGYTGIIRKFLTRVVASNAEAITTVTIHLKHAMLEHGIRNHHYDELPNVVDTKVFFPQNKLRNPEEKKRLVHISCFDDEPKNISGLIHCILHLRELRDDFIVDMIGTGKDFDRMVELSKKTGLYNSVMFFKGQQEGTELGNCLRIADVLLLFSNYENMPVVINEALCCGIPVVSTDVGGIREVINQSNGILVPKGDQQAFVTKLNFLLDNLDSYDRKQISIKANNMFSIQAISEKIDGLYSTKY